MNNITIIDTPLDYQPVYSDGLFFTISADTTDKYKFRYTYDIYVENQLVFQGKSTPNPSDLGVIDVSLVLQTYTENNPLAVYNTTPIYAHQTFPFSRPYQNQVVPYQVKFGYEYASTPLGVISGFTGVDDNIGLPEITDKLRKVYLGTMGVNGRATQQDFDFDPFVLSGTPVGADPTTTGLFLTNSPRIRNIASDEYYTLGFSNYYLNESSMLSEPYYVEYNYYDENGVLLDTEQYMNLQFNGGMLPSCSWVYPSYYNTVGTGDTTWNTMYVGAGPANIGTNFPSGTTQYTVQLFGHFTGTTSPPAPSPTPTPTPSTTPGCAQCFSYDITNPSLEYSAVVYYTECDRGPVRIITIPSNSVARIDCACQGSLIYEASLVVLIIDSCGGVPSPTPTPTPTPTPCVCESYTVTNTGSEAQLTVNWLDCDRVEQSIILNPLLGYGICACIGTVTASGSTYTIVDDGPCGPPTPTPTPTPSATPDCIPQVIYECTNICQGGECFCDNPTPTNVYAHPGVLPSDVGQFLYSDCGLTTIWYGDYEYGGIIYNASPITPICVVGGPC